MTLGELIGMTRELLADDVNWVPTTELVSGQTWSADQYQDSANFAIKLYCQKRRCTYKEEATAIVTPSSATLPTDTLEMVRVLFNNSELVRSNLDFEYLKSPTWISATAPTPKRWVQTDGKTVRMLPAMATWTPATCTIGHLEMPALLSSSASSVDTRVLPEHCEYLKYAAASYLLKFKTDQESLAREQSYMATFNQLIGVA